MSIQLCAVLLAMAFEVAVGIFGGKIADAADYPFYVSFVANDSWGRKASVANNCGGTLIGGRWVITARHCRTAFDAVETAPYAKYGVHPLYKAGVNVGSDGSFAKLIPVERFEVCPDDKYPASYKGPLPPGFKPYVDCALVKLSEDARDYGAKVAPMYRGVKPVGHEVTMLGMGSYGYCRDCRVSPFLRAATTVVAGDENCQPPDVKFGFYNATRSICAGVADVHLRTGYGDSGGPLVIYSEGRSRVEYIGTVSGGVGIPGGERNFSRFLYSSFIADWAERVMHDDLVRENMHTSLTARLTSLPLAALVAAFFGLSICFAVRLRRAWSDKRLEHEAPAQQHASEGYAPLANACP